MVIGNHVWGFIVGDPVASMSAQRADQFRFGDSVVLIIFLLRESDNSVILNP